MPYDYSKTRNLLTIVGAFSGHPGGEYIADLAAQLRDAETEITNAGALKAKAEAESNRYASDLATMQATMRQLREENEALKAAPSKKRPAADQLVPAPDTAASTALAPPVAPAEPKRARAKKPIAPAS